MKCNSKKVQQAKFDMECEKLRKEREDMLNAMSEEERNTYLENERKEQEESRERVERFLKTASMICSNFGIRKFY